MAIADSTVTVTAACELGTHKCRGTVYTLTRGLGSPATACQCSCHAPEPVTDDELEAVIEAEAERAVEHALEVAHFGADL